jgi:hypothetical protein
MLGAFGLLAAASLTLPILVMNVGQTSAATVTLVPNADKVNAGGWTNHANAACGTDSIATTCSATIDEDIDSPVDTDFVQSGNNPNALQTVQFHLSDAPGDLATLTDLTVRFRASKNNNNRVMTLSVEIRKSDNTLIGSPIPVTLTTTATTNSYAVSSLSLSASEVNGLYVQFRPKYRGWIDEHESISANGELRYQLHPGNPNRDRHGDGHSDCNANRNGDRHSHGDRDGDGYTHGDGYGDSDSNGHAYSDAHRHANCDSHQHAHGNADQYTDRHAHQHAYSDANRHTDRHTHQHSDRDPHQHAHSDADQHADRNPNGHAHCNADQYTDAYADQHTDAYADQHTDCNGYRDADGYAHTDTHSDGYAHAQSWQGDWRRQYRGGSDFLPDRRSSLGAGNHYQPQPRRQGDFRLRRD